MRLTIDSRLERVREVGQQARAFCLDRGLAAEQAALVELAVVEAVNNAIIHAYRGAPGRRVLVEMSAGPDELIFSITDWGEAFSPENRPAGDASTESRDPLAESGRGLALMGMIMDRMDYGSRDGANTMTLGKRWQPA